MAFWNKKNNNKESSLSLSDVLAKTVAGHYPEATVDGATVTLGATGIRVECEADDPQEMGSLLTVALYLRVSGGPFGPEPSFASISGYAPWGEECDMVGQSVYAVMEGGCMWTCTLLDVLGAAGLVAPRESDEERPEVVGRPALIGGRRYQVWSNQIDRTLAFGESGPQYADVRARLGGDSTMTSAVLATDTLPVHASNHALLLSTFAMTTSQVTTEVKVHGGDWPPSWAPLTAVGPTDGGITMLRELAVAVPAEPARWDRDRLAWTLAAVGTYRTEPHQAAGWRGWRRHGGQLQAPLTDAQIAAAGVDPAGLPADYHHFLTQVGWGAGPGYGLLGPTLSDLGLVLAQAGDQVCWYLAPSGGVWADTRTFGLDPVQTHDSFDAWYADWLDNAVAGLQPWQQWDGSCASLNMLYGMLDDGIDVNSMKGIEIGMSSDENGQTVQPCHHCQATFARFGVGDEAWTG
ncbi:MAG: hypothetical protein FWH11_02620 [Micrococcales bacterium]|nr:hypothetical protein [Micrococcales bacterium]